jgi:hypothetical protein
MKLLQICAALLAVGSGLLLAGCSHKPILVRVVEVKHESDYRGTWSERYPYMIVERLDTKERIMMHPLGETGEVFAVRENGLHW